MTDATSAPRWIATETLISQAAWSRAARPLPLAYGEVAEFDRPSPLWPLVKVALVGFGMVAIGFALIVWAF